MGRPIAAALVMALCVAPAAAQHAPSGWFKAGLRADEYETGTDRQVKRSGEASAFIRNRVPDPGRGFGTLMQTVSADQYRGKRLRFAGYLKSDRVQRWAGLWMRVDGPDRKPLAFDNMQERAVQGTLDWQRAEIVLDVPPEAVDISFGLLLDGAGQIWADDLTLDPVGSEVPVTGRGRRPPPHPSNLNFEKKPAR